MRGYIKYVTRKPLGKKPAIFSTGGYSGKTKDGKEIIFDWLDSYGRATVREDGHVEIEVDLCNFDEEFTVDSSDKNSGADKLTPESLTAITLTEVFYECFADEEEEDFIYLDVVEFAVYDPDIDIECEFKNLKEYNKKYSIKEEAV